MDFKESVLSRPALRINGLLKNVYLWMTAGLALTGVVAYATASSEVLLKAIFSSYFGIFLVVGLQIGLVIYLSSRINRMSVRAAVIAFMAYSITTGVMLSSIILAYSGLVISRAFFTTALLFAGMSIFAMTTKRNLNTWGSYLIMGLWGLVISTVLNLFIGSETIYYVISYIGVGVFMGLTAWDTQKIMRMNVEYGENIDEDSYVKLSIIGALTLYLDFINIFLYLVRILGNRRN